MREREARQCLCLYVVNVLRYRGPDAEACIVEEKRRKTGFGGAATSTQRPLASSPYALRERLSEVSRNLLRRRVSDPRTCNYGLGCSRHGWLHAGGGWGSCPVSSWAAALVRPAAACMGGAPAAAPAAMHFTAALSIHPTQVGCVLQHHVRELQ